MSDTYTLIKNGMVIDGTGSEPTQCDVLVHGPRIVHVGTDAATHLPADTAHSEIDASGCRVLPGLIDSHCHISFDQPNSNDELFFHRRYGLAALVAGGQCTKGIARRFYQLL